MHLAKALPDSVSFFHDDFEWMQPIDYEYVQFHCRKCHAHGHLFRDYPLNPPSNKRTATSANSDEEGFTKVPTRKRHHKKTPSSAAKPSTQASDIPPTNNNIGILAKQSQPDSDIPSKTAPPLTPSASIPSSDSHIPPSHSKPPPESFLLPPKPNTETKLVIWQPNNMDVDGFGAEGSQDSHMEEEPESIDIGELEIFGLEQACRKKDYDKISYR